MARHLVPAVLVAAVLGFPSGASAADIAVWTTRAIATVLAEIGGEFEQTTGHKLVVTSDLPPGFLRRARDGERFDLLITGSDPIEQWFREGRLVATTRAAIARSGIGVEVRAGSLKPDISSVSAFTQALVNAKSIAYLNVGSGIHLHGVMKRLGIAKDIEAKVVRPDTDIVSELVARGEVELGMVVITQILTSPGVELVGPLPPDLQSYVTFEAGVSAESKVPGAASQLIAFLRGTRAAAVIRSQGMEPAQ